MQTLSKTEVSLLEKVDEVLADPNSFRHALCENKGHGIAFWERKLPFTLAEARLLIRTDALLERSILGLKTKTELAQLWLAEHHQYVKLVHILALCLLTSIFIVPSYIAPLGMCVGQMPPIKRAAHCIFVTVTH